MIEWCVWDAEQTLYRSTSELDAEVHKKQYEVVAEHKKISFDAAKALFDAERARQPGDTATFVALGIGRHGTQEALEKIDKSRYLSKDAGLQNVFDELKEYKHAIITNASRTVLYDLLGILGLERDLFKIILTADDVESYKPMREPFDRFLRLSGARPELCVSIGDRDRTDIIPAKELGMKTIMVWDRSAIADYSAPSVYDVPLYVRKL